MNTQELFPYLLEVLIMSSIGSAGYMLILRKETKLIWNRAFLLVLLLLSVILPFFSWTISLPWATTQVSEYLLDSVLLTAETVQQQDLNWGIGILLGGAIISLMILGYKVFSLVRFSQNCPSGNLQGIPVLLTQGRLSTSSFGKWLFWDETTELTQEQEAMILQHEQCHINQRHSLDLLLVEVLLIPFWWNPAFHLIRFLIVSNHEALADRDVLTTNDQVAYRRLLLSQWLRPQFSLTHEFHLSHIKHRIDMLFTISTPYRRSWKHLLAVPFLLLGSVMISCQSDAVAEQATVISEPSVNQVVEMNNTPQPLNLQEIRVAIGYPKAASAEGIEGQVVARILIGTSGEYVRHEWVKNDHEILAQAVEAHISQLKFKPAVKDGEAVKFWINIPFNFVLE